MLEFIKKFLKRIAIGLVDEIKTEILPVLADEVVIIIEENLKGEKGETKKREAVNLILNKIDKYIPAYLKPLKDLIKDRLIYHIDEAIEIAVTRLKNKK